jgi:hypothetical protein
VLRRRSFIEHKSSSEDITPGSLYWRKLTLDSQVGNYFRGAESLGIDAESCMYDVLKKPASKPKNVPVLDEDGIKVVLDKDGVRVRTKCTKKWRQTGDAELGWVLQTRAETPDEYEARLIEEIAAEPDAYYQRSELVRLESEREEYERDLKLFATAIKNASHDNAPRNPDACVRKGHVCPFFDVCTGVASLDDPRLYRIAKRPHEELSGDVC